MKNVYWSGSGSHRESRFGFWLITILTFVLPSEPHKIEKLYCKMEDNYESAINHVDKFPIYWRFGTFDVLLQRTSMKNSRHS